jgi:translation initiation factor RLI1
MRGISFAQLASKTTSLQVLSPKSKPNFVETNKFSVSQSVLMDFSLALADWGSLERGLDFGSKMVLI